MMTRQEHLLACLSEEAAEVVQRVTKALRFGLTEREPAQPFDNADRIARECNDLLAVLKMLEEAGIISQHITRDNSAIQKKRSKVERFMQYAIEIGAMEP